MYVRLTAALLLATSGCALHEQAVKRAEQNRLEDEQERKKYAGRLACEKGASTGSHFMGDDCVDVDHLPKPSGPNPLGTDGPQQTGTAFRPGG